jgi:hypothetical protein
MYKDGELEGGVVAAEHEIEIEIQPPGVAWTEAGWIGLPKKGQADRAVAGHEQWLNGQWMNWTEDCFLPSSPAGGSGLAGFNNLERGVGDRGTGLRKAISGAGESPVCWGLAKEAADDVGVAGQADPEISPNPGTNLPTRAINLERSRRQTASEKWARGNAT